MRKPAFLPRLCPAFARKKAIWRDLWSFQNEAISLVAMRSKESWLVEKTRATVKPDSSVALRWMKTYSESKIELRNLHSWRKCWKNQVSFVIGAALWAKKLWRCPENYRSWKNTLGKLVVAVNPEAIWFEFRMKGALVTVEIFVFCGW